MDLTEHCIHTEVLAKGDLLTVKRDEVRLPSGHISHREYVVHPGAVVVVPMLPNGKLLMERQFRYSLHQVFIELPAGKIDPNEDTLRTGQRELQEETGYVSNDWVKLGLQHPCIGYSNEVIHIYLARNLIPGKPQCDEDEALELFEVSFSECTDMIQRGEITDSKTITAIFLAEKYLQLHE